MTQPDTPQSNQDDKAVAGSRNTVTRGALLLVFLFAVVIAWPFLSGRAPSSEQQLDAFVAADPQLVAIGGASAPVITGEDVTPRFFSLSDMASPAEIRMATAPLFDSKQPAHVWIFAEKSWADGAHGADMAILLDDIKARDIAVTLVLPPQGGETADETIDAFARLSHDKGVTFLDYHDADKLGAPLCAAGGNDAAQDAAETYHTQQMLLHMAINAPDLRPQLRLADIGARIERLKAETVCADAATVPADDAITEEAPAATATDVAPAPENGAETETETETEAE